MFPGLIKCPENIDDACMAARVAQLCLMDCPKQAPLFLRREAGFVIGREAFRALAGHCGHRVERRGVCRREVYVGSGLQDVARCFLFGRQERVV